jgi:hypothetical protein
MCRLSARTKLTAISHPGGSNVKNDQDEALEKILASNLARVFDLQKFAEAKNAVLLTLCSAWLIGLLNILANERIVPWIKTPILISSPWFVLAGLLALYSFRPRNLWFFTDEKKELENRNLLFFVDIHATGKRDFINEAIRRYKPGADHNITQGYIDDICTQTHINAGITNKKFKLFFGGVISFFVGCVSLAICTAICALKTGG